MSERGGAGELTALVARWRKFADTDHSQGMKLSDSRKQSQYELMMAGQTLAYATAASELERALAAKAPQGVPACEYCEALWERDEKTMKHRHPSVAGFGAFAYKCTAAPSAPSLPVPGPVSDTTIHHGMFPPATSTARTVSSGMARDLDEAAAPKPAPCELCGGTGKFKDASLADAPTESCPCGATPAPGAERLREQALENLAAVIKEARANSYLPVEIICAHNNLERVREALAAAPPAPEEEEPMPCERCQENAETVWIPTGFSGEREPLCGKCISLMLDEGHASAERVRELEQAITYLAREASAVLGMTGMREAIGNTNMHCLQRRIDEALRALPPSTGEKS